MVQSEITWIFLGVLAEMMPVIAHCRYLKNGRNYFSRSPIRTSVGRYGMEA